MSDSPTLIDLDNDSFDKPAETYEELKKHMRKKLNYRINCLNDSKECSYSSSEISSMMLYIHIKYSWWIEEIFGFSHAESLPY
jgi:hypothetical protein